LDILIKSATEEDIPQIATVHKEQFPTHFLGRYSKSLIEKFYRCFLREESIFLVCEHGGSIIGFVLGGTSNNLSKSKNIFLKEYKNDYIVETILTPSVYLLAASRIKPLFLSSFLRKDNRKSELVIEAVRLLSIAVDDNAKGKGIANMLVDAFESRIQSATNYGLSVNKSNSRAIKFYRRTGFTIEKETEDSIYLIKDIMKND
jgi:ribosomal protein S18 acetylase RimI-like enzyme